MVAAVLATFVVAGVCALLALLVWDDVVAANYQRWRDER